MPIREPGYRPVRSRLQVVKRSGRTIAATLSLTAMVDLFTVLTVFLLQNYSVTGVALHLPKEVVLPAAIMSEDLTPANVVTITKDSILVGTRQVAALTAIRAQDKWLIQELREQLQVEIAAAKEKGERSAVGLREGYRDVTVQADRDVEFAIIKRVIYTATESGAGEVNFAVLKKSSSEQ
jgi:biopolymer transport protein ExbD